MFVLHKALYGRHLSAAFFRRGEKRNWRRLAEEEERAGTEMAIIAYGTPLFPVTYSMYLGRVLSVVDND